MCETSMFRPKDGSESVLVLCRAAFGSSRGYLRGSLGPRDRPKRVSRFVLELCSASCARFLLPKMAWGASMLCFISPRSLLESILSFHTDPPTLENDDFTMVRTTVGTCELEPCSWAPQLENLRCGAWNFKDDGFTLVCTPAGTYECEACSFKTWWS